MDRRHFLQQTGAAALLERTLQSAPTVVRAGLLGTKHSHTIGKLKAMQDNPDYQVAGICETDAVAKAEAQSDQRFKGLQWLSEAEMLADKSIDLVVVECNVWEALPWAKKVIDAGKHLHQEKPVGNEWGKFKTLVEEARRKKLLFQTGYVWRCHEGVNAALDAARKGWLGEVLMVRGTMNADRSAQERLKEARYKGGGLFELAGHVIDRTVDLLGRPKKVQSWLRHDTSVADTLKDNNLTVFEYDKALAIITQSAKMSGSSDHRSFEVVGTDGTFMVYPEANPPRMRVHMRKAQGPYHAGWQEITLPPQPRFIGDFQELARAIKSGTPLKLSYEHELLLQETLLRASGEIV